MANTKGEDNEVFRDCKTHLGVGGLCVWVGGWGVFCVGGWLSVDGCTGHNYLGGLEYFAQLFMYKQDISSTKLGTIKLLHFLFFDSNKNNENSVVILIKAIYNGYFQYFTHLIFMKNIDIYF